MLPVVSKSPQILMLGFCCLGQNQMRFLLQLMSTITTLFLSTLVYEFWLSGLLILSVIFLPIQDLDSLTLYTFLAYAVGSFLTGVLSDVVGRRPLFLVSSLLLFGSSIAANFDLWAGLIAANLCIGPLNNLTFLFLNENRELSSEHNYVKVLFGWVASEITLGLYFLLEGDPKVFLFSLCPLTGIYAMLAFFLTRQTENFTNNKEKLRQRHWKSIFIPNQLKALLGGSLLMFMMQMFYYRTQFTLDRFGVSLPINTIIVGATQGLANATFYKAVLKCRRKRTLFILLGCLVVLLFCLTVVKDVVVQSVIQGVMRYCDSSIMLVLGFYIPQLFSVEEKGKGLNYVMSLGVMGSALSGKIFSQLPLGYLELFLFSAAFGLMMLPETLKVGEEDPLNEQLVLNN